MIIMTTSKHKFFWKKLSQRTENRYTMRSQRRPLAPSFPGAIEEIPFIYCDNFTDMDKNAYFLSHCHTDHTVGLYDDAFLQRLARTNARIYTSEISAAIVIHESGDKEMEKYVVPLKLGRHMITVPCDGEESHMAVTLIPAGHCFGSVMFLFELKNKVVLFTGDFRINVNDLPKYNYLHRNGTPLELDAMYVDTTFQDDKHINFPKRSESVSWLIREITEWLDRDSGNVVNFSTSAKYGYEFVFNEVYEKTGFKTVVDGVKWALYSKFEHKLPGVTNISSNGRIYLENYKLKRRFNVRLSAQLHENYDADAAPVKEKLNGISVCFATHCSRSELDYFVNYFKSKKVVGFEKNYVPPTPEKRKIALNLTRGRKASVKRVFDVTDDVTSKKKVDRDK